MDQPQRPAIQRRRVRVALKRARMAAGLTQKDVAEAMDWSLSKVIRMEGGGVTVQPADVRLLMRHYDFSDQDEIEDLVQAAREAKRKTQDYADVYAGAFLKYLDYEATASKMRQFQPLMIPGLLQTEGYAREILSDVFRHDQPDKIDRHVEARLDRQQQLHGELGPEFRFIIDEPVLQRVVGSPDIMRRQLEQLKKLNELPRVNISVLPLSVGGNPGMRGPFILLEFDDPDDDDLLFLESPGGDYTTRDNEETISAYLEMFDELSEKSLSGDAFRDRVDRTLVDFHTTTSTDT
jgi:transcriptional regulator with XRE-family HTH domain